MGVTQKKKYNVQVLLGVANGKSETRRDTETGILKSETETENFSDLIEKHICDRQTRNLRLRDQLLGCARFRDLGRICQDSLLKKEKLDLYPVLKFNQF